MTIRPVTIEKDTLKDCNVHRRSQGMETIHKNYGLWIFCWQRRQESMGDTTINPRYFEFYGLLFTDLYRDLATNG